MAKNKHEQLADLMRAMIAEINDHLTQCQILLRSTSTIRQCMISAPYGASQKWWPVIKNWDSQIPINLKREFYKMLLYCPDKKEFSSELDWYEEEDEADSFSYQIHSIHEYCRREEIIRHNLLKDPMPIYEETIRKWVSDCNSSDNPAKNPKKLKEASFAPKKGQTIARAYETLRMSIRKRESRHRQNLRMHYGKALETAMFEGLPLRDPKRDSFLREWEKNMFGEVKKVSSANGGQCKAIDLYVAGQCIEKLVCDFINNPAKRGMGETACILWILIWASREPSYGITIKEVLNLTTQQIHQKEAVIKLDNNRNLKISNGIHKLLLCLMGFGFGKRSRGLFKNVKNLKALERIMLQLSEDLGIVPAVLPASFLILIHAYSGVRMSATQRRMMQNVSTLVPYSFRMRREKILATLKGHAHGWIKLS